MTTIIIITDKVDIKTGLVYSMYNIPPRTEKTITQAQLDNCLISTCAIK
jgi:hypothetical protein